MSKMLNITIDNFDDGDNPENGWTAAIEEGTEDGWERSDASFGATPQEALANVLREFGKEYGL